MNSTELEEVPVSRSKGKLIITLLCAAIALLYVYTGYMGQLPLYQQRGILLAVGFIVVFTTIPMFKGRRSWWTVAISVAFALITVLSVIQAIRAEKITPLTGYYIPTTYDYILAAGVIIAVLEAARRTIGPILPILAVIAILYAMFGHNLPGVFQHTELSVPFALYYLGITTEGIWGIPLYVVSTVIIMFMVFAALLRQCGLLQFFIDISNGLVGKYRGGPAKIAIVASSIMATISGSGVANVAATGAFTIPLMKKTGYSSTFAGAVEADASTGGVITPPVMGAAAFIMAEYLGISYWSICVAAFLPAALYYIGLYVGVDMEAMKSRLVGLPKEDIPNAGKLLLHGGYMLIPIVVLLYFLGVVRSSAMLACFWGIISILLLSLIRKNTRQNLFSGMNLIEGFASGARDLFVSVLPTITCAGIVVGVLTSTGLGVRLSSIMVAMTGGNLLSLLLFCAIVSIILGMGMTTVSVYLLVALVVAPAIIRLGVEPLAAHLFVFFFGNLSHITPPVCVAVYVACGISGAQPFPTAWQSIKLGAILFIVPFFFCFNSALILQGSITLIIVSMFTAIIGVIAVTFALSNYSFFGKTGIVQRILFGIGGLALTYPGILPSLVGAVLVIPPLVYGIYRKHTHGLKPEALS
ncbi:TRAP transporter permease [Chloroflexota bacterium]